jgi:hypothetical protein
LSQSIDFENWGTACKSEFLIPVEGTVTEGSNSHNLFRIPVEGTVIEGSNSHNLFLIPVEGTVTEGFNSHNLFLIPVEGTVTEGCNSHNLCEKELKLSRGQCCCVELQSFSFIMNLRFR